MMPSSQSKDHASHFVEYSQKKDGHLSFFGRIHHLSKGKFQFHSHSVLIFGHFFVRFWAEAKLAENRLEPRFYCYLIS